MPFVRITLTKGHNKEFKRHISQAIHQSLQQIFRIPVDDYFQVIEELEPDNLIFPESYMGIPHSNELIYIQITAKAGRTVGMKQELYQAITREITQRTSHSSDNLIITLIENDSANWSFGRGIAQLVA